MNANELAEIIQHLENANYIGASKAATMLRQQQAEIEALKKRCLDEIFKRTYADRSAEVMCDYWELAQAEVDGLKMRIERMIENQSHHEGIAHAGGFEVGYEAGRKMGMQQERALWELAASTQENRMGITFTGGFTTHEAAEEHRQKFMHKDLYTIATVFDAAAGKHIAHFPIPAKAADLIMAFDESAHGIGE